MDTHVAWAQMWESPLQIQYTYKKNIIFMDKAKYTISNGKI